MSSARRALGLLTLAVIAIAAVAAGSIVAPGHTGAQAASMHNCPPPGNWAIAVWDGESGTAADDALATCGADAVAAAYSLDPETGSWSRWFAGKPDVSNLEPLDELQGVLALGGAVAAAGGDSLAAAQAEGEVHNCPPAGKWSIAVWDGPSGTAAADALATCGAGAVDAAYSIDAQTGGWRSWFAGRPEIGRLATLDDMQGVLALGVGAKPPLAGPEADLAAQLYAATDTDAAAIPMLQVYAYLGAGLYTVDDQPIQAGAETGPDDFIIYDFESGILLQTYIERQRFPVDRLATFLGQAGVVNLETGQPFTGSEWLAVLAEAVSRGREDDSAFTVRLIDALGLVRSTPLDLTASGLDPASTYLDAVQVFLILYDVLFGLPAEAGVASTSSAVGLDTVALAEDDGLVRKAGQIAILVAKKWVGGALVLGEEVFHDWLLARGFKVTLEPVEASTHWFPCEGSHEVTLKATVVFDVGKYNEAVKNAHLMRIEYLPVPGPQDDIRVSWRADDILIPENGSWKETANSEMTDEHGEASIIFVPRTEARPGEGIPTEKPGSFGVAIQRRSLSSPLVILDLMAVLSEDNYAFGNLWVKRHQNWTVEIVGGSCQFALSYEFASAATINFPGGEHFPLQKVEGGLGANRTVMTEITSVTQGDPPCTWQWSSPAPVDAVVGATVGEGTLTLLFGGTSLDVFRLVCPPDFRHFETDDDLVVEAGPCTMPAEDGAIVECPFAYAGVVSCHVTLKLEED